MKKFNAFDPVLIRENAYEPWDANFYDRPYGNGKDHWTICGSLVKDADILPYNKETKHLHGTVGEFTEWKPKKGEPILVRDNDSERWILRVFLEMRNKYFACTAEPEEPNCVFCWNQAKPYVNPFKE